MKPVPKEGYTHGIVTLVLSVTLVSVVALLVTGFGYVVATYF